jgi:hypothetical protein
MSEISDLVKRIKFEPDIKIKKELSAQLNNLLEKQIEIFKKKQLQLIGLSIELNEQRLIKTDNYMRPITY